jgi:hypothetical protein
MEIKTGLSLKELIHHFKSITDARIFNSITGKEFVLQSEIKPKIFEILKKINA